MSAVMKDCRGVSFLLFPLLLLLLLPRLLLVVLVLLLNDLSGLVTDRLTGGGEVTLPPPSPPPPLLLLPLIPDRFELRCFVLQLLSSVSSLIPLLFSPIVGSNGG